MSRQARIDDPGALQHIIVREIERRRIFAEDADRQGFVARLDRREHRAAAGRRASRGISGSWAVRELGVTTAAIARRLGLSQPAIRTVVRRGEDIARTQGLRLLDG